MKYKTIKELADAFKSGEMNKDKYVVQMDNDESFLGVSWEWADKEAERLSKDGDHIHDSAQDEADGLWRGNGPADIIEAFEALGIPCESV